MTSNDHSHLTETINHQNSYNNTNFDNLEFSYDVFDVLDHNDETDDQMEVDNISEQFNQDFDFDYLNTNVDEEEMAMIFEDGNSSEHVQHNEKLDEETLSQKLSQLSAKDIDSDEEQQPVEHHNKRPLSTSSTPDVPTKKIRPDKDNVDNENLNDDIPAYLQSANIRILYDVLMNHIKNHPSKMITDELRQLAILKHKIMYTNLRVELWRSYYKAGTGQLQTQKSQTTNVDRRIWPVEVRKMMLSKETDLIDITEDLDEQNQYEDMVYEHLKHLNNRIQQYENEFNKKKYDLINYTDEIDRIIETFIRKQGLPLLQMKLNYKSTMLQFDYDSEILVREYLQLKPTRVQIQQAKRLHDLRSKYLESIQKLIEIKQRILSNKLPESMIPLSVQILQATMDAQINETIDQKQKDKQEKKVQKELTDSMIALIIGTQDTIHEYEELFDAEILELFADDASENDPLTRRLIDIIYQRFKILEQKLHYINNFRINYFLQTPFSDLNDTEYYQSTIRFSPTIIIHTASHQFTDEQLRFLSRGPTYIPPCQMYVSSTDNDLIDKQYKLLHHHLTILYKKFNINTAQAMFINKEIKDLFIDCFSTSLPSKLYQRALHEKALVHSSHQHLKMNDLILRRTADRRNVFYLGNQKGFDEKTNHFMMKTDMFVVDKVIDNDKLRQTQEYLNKIIQSMNSEFKKMFTNKVTRKSFLDKLLIDETKVQLSYLYFLPDLSKENTMFVKPIVYSKYSATYRLAQFLDELLRPAVQRQTQSITFTNGADFMRKLNRYANDEHRLKLHTRFATINILNYHTAISHKTMLDALTDFLDSPLVIAVKQTISIQRFIALTSLFLENNRFYYNNQIYRYVKGSPTTIPFTETLCQIYAYQWQKILLNELIKHNECYGQHKNQIFFTWNETATNFRELFQTVFTKYPHVKLEVRLFAETHFLNAYIQNLNGTLFTSVYHDPSMQKYTMPYVIDNSLAAHSHWFLSSLIQAARYCVSVFDFNQECISLEISCLTNGYSLDFVNSRIKHFYDHFGASSLRSSLDQNVYDKLRHRLFNFVSEQHHILSKNRELEQNKQLIRLSYLYQYGSKQTFNKKLKEILMKHLIIPTDIFSKKNAMKIIITTKQQYSLNALLSQQKPSHVLLLNKEKNIF